MNMQLVNAIRELTNSSTTTKSKVARIRELMPEIYRAQQAGVRLADIALTLNGSGFEGMNLKCLQNLMYQARKGGKRPSVISSAMLMPTACEDHKFMGIAKGINPDSILEEARKSMQSRPPASSLTLHLLRSQTTQSTNELKEIK